MRRKTRKLTYHPIVKMIWDDLCDRSGFDLDGLDKETQIEIKDAWEKLVREQVENKRLCEVKKEE